MSRTSIKLFFFAPLAIVVIGLLAGAWYWRRHIAAGNETPAKTSAVDEKKADIEAVQLSVVDAALEQKIAAWAVETPGDFGVVIREIDNQKRFAHYQAEKSFVPASTYKLFTVYAYLYQVQEGRQSLDDRLPNGVRIKDCIESLLVRSDNDCTRSFSAKMGGWEQIDIFLRSQGFTGTTLDNYDETGDFTGDKTTTGNDQAELLYRLETGTLLNQDMRDYMLELMRRQVWRQRIQAGLPTHIATASKPGWLTGDIENDSGIVYAPSGRYVIVILSVGSSQAALAELSELIYQHMSGS